MFNPWFIIGVALALVGVFEYGHHQGYSECKQEEALAIASKNQEMNDAKEKADAQFKQVQQQLADKQSQLRDAVRTGNQRLYVRLATDPANPSSSDGKTAAQLDPVFAESLVAITDRGDQAIVSLNACIDQYDKMREIVSGRR
jgi:hypothetical protein